MSGQIIYRIQAFRYFTGITENKTNRDAILLYCRCLFQAIPEETIFRRLENAVPGSQVNRYERFTYIILCRDASNI